MRTSVPSRQPIKAKPDWRIGIVVSSYYHDEIQAMTDSARSFLKASGIAEENISMHTVPGCFEIPLRGAELAAAKKVDGLIALGVIVQGETRHGDLLAAETTRGIMDVQLGYLIPFAFEVLHVSNVAQAQARSDKGEEAAYAVLSMLSSRERL